MSTSKKKPRKPSKPAKSTKRTASGGRKSAAGSSRGSKRGKAPKAKSRRRAKSKRTLRQRLLRAALAAVLLGILSLFALFGAVYIGLFGPLPTTEELKGIHNVNAAEVFSSDGELLGKYFVQNRTSVGFEDIPPIIVDALVATEDSRYFEHEGIDFYSIPRVVIRSVLLGDRSAGGGSTLSQQLIKNVFGRKRHGVLSIPVNKLKENIAALKLEDIYSKEEIIAMYLNTVSFGENVYGIKAASLRFFNKTPQELEVEEVATLIGMLKANTTYNPRLHPEASRERRNTVLALMARQGTIPESEVKALQALPLKIDYRNLEGRGGTASYLRAYLRDEIESLLAHTDRGDGSPYNLLTDGLKITLTINADMQAKAESVVHRRLAALQESFDQHWEGRRPNGLDEDFLWQHAKNSVRYKRLQSAGRTEEAIRKVFETPTEVLVYTPEGPKTRTMTPLDSIAHHQMILQTGFLAVESATGRVLAYVGGIDHSFFPYDHVHSRRQVGSTFKPFVYTAALEAGYSPCDYIENEQVIFSNYDDWSPKNAGGTYGGWYTLKGGLANSVNVVAARLIAETGPAAVRDVARRVGIDAELPRGPAIALGVADLSLAEMVEAYIPLANRGTRHDLQYIERIESSDGQVLFTAEKSPQNRSHRALDADIAETMRAMLELVVDSGTARSIHGRYGVRTPMAGKTGTTQNNSDGWFIGITPRITCGAWVGGESPLVRFRSTALGQGAATALPIVADWVKACESDRGTASKLGSGFAPLDPELALDMVCPLYTDSRTESFFEGLFNKDSRRKKRDIRERATEKERKDQKDDKDKEGGWIKRLFDKLKK